MNQVQEFMSRVVPWPGDNDAPGYVNLHWRAVNIKDKTKKYWGGKPTRTVESFLAAASWAMQRDFIEDLYFCTSLQSQAGKNTKGNPTVARSKDLALSLKAIWLDVDVKEPPKGYPTLEAALAGVAKFVKDTDLPPPSALIATGGGLHVYWISDRPLPVEVWQPYAEGLKSLAIKHGLLCDAGVTSDAARILRVPGTHNFKSMPPRPVRILGIKPRELDYDFSRQLQQLPTLVPVHATPRNTTTHLKGGPSASFTSLQAETLSEGIKQDETPLAWEPIAMECAFIRDALKTGGKDYSQPMWNLSTLAATFMDQGHALAHKMGNQHPGYSRDSTEALWDRKVRERKDRGLGWPSCAAIQAAGCVACSTCKHFQKGKSPLNLSAHIQTVNEKGEVVLAPVLDNTLHLPEGYRVNDTGHICKIEPMKGKAGEAGETIDVQLFHNKITNPIVESNPKAISFTVTSDKGHTERVTIQASQIVNGTEMWKVLQGQGLLPFPRQRANAEEFLMAWLSKLQEAKEAANTVPFGWWRNNDGKRDGFVYGGLIMKSDGTEIPSGAGDRVLRQSYTPCGSMQPWLDAFKVVADLHSPALEAIIAASFAAPLMVTTGEYSCMLSCWGPSGAFKTSAMKVGLSVWGHPKRTKAVTKTTTRSALNQMGEIKNLPMYWDEIKEETLQPLYETFFDATQGVEGGRLTSDVKQRHKGDWQTMMITGSNYNFIDFLANMQKSTDAGIYRVFEYELTPVPLDHPGVISDMDASRIMQELETNFGVVGMKYAKMLSLDPMGIDDMTKKICEDFRAQVDPKPAERYWTATCGTLIAGATLANLIGASFDVDALRKFLKEQYLRNRERRASEATEGGTEIHAEEALTNFLRDNLDHTLYTDTFPQGRGKPPAISVIHGPKIDSGKGIRVHWAIKDKMLRFSRSEFRKYLMHQKVPPTSVMRGLAKHFKMEQHYAMLGANTPWTVGQSHLVYIPVEDGTPLAMLMNAHRPLSEIGQPSMSQQMPPAASG